MQVHPIFVHLLGINPDSNLTADLADPRTYPMLAVCFGLNGLVETGYYLPDFDDFDLLVIDDEDPSKDHLETVPRDSDYHKACLDTVTYFAKDLAEGKASVEGADIPKWLSSKRMMRTQRLSSKTGGSSPATCPTPLSPPPS